MSEQATAAGGPYKPFMFESNIAKTDGYKDLCWLIYRSASLLKRYVRRNVPLKWRKQSVSILLEYDLYDLSLKKRLICDDPTRTH